MRRFRVIVEHHQLPPPAPNLLEQRFTTSALNRVWAGDVTMVPTRAGWLYMAVLLDLCSRRVIGWAMRDKPDQQLMLAALPMAARRRRDHPGLIQHSDRGAQYSCVAYQRQLTTLGITHSMMPERHLLRQRGGGELLQYHFSEPPAVTPMPMQGALFAT